MILYNIYNYIYIRKEKIQKTSKDLDSCSISGTKLERNSEQTNTLVLSFELLRSDIQALLVTCEIQTPQSRCRRFPRETSKHPLQSQIWACLKVGYPPCHPVVKNLVLPLLFGSICGV